MVINSEIEKRAVDFLKNITQKDGIITIFHNDADGIASCTLLDLFLIEKIKRGSDFMISQPMPPTKTLVQRVKLSLPTKIIFLDLAIDQEKRIIKSLERICEILVIDHHQISNNLNSKKTIHYNPLFNNTVYQSASYLTYKILSKIFDMSKYLWIALIGIAGDYNIKDSMDLIFEGRKIYEKYFGKEDDITQGFLNSSFKRVSDIITSLKAYGIPCERIVKALEAAESIEEIENNSEFLNYHEKVQKEIDAMMVKIKSEIREIGDIIFYEMKSGYSLRSVIATKLSELYPKKVIFVWEVVKNTVKFSVRNQNGNINVEKILKEASKDFKTAITGGHKLAAAGSIKKDEFDLFREKIVEILSKNEL
jgi:single-stranded DNA-specific DHH superfamily exonuclease